MLGSNMTGMNKLTPLVIGKSNSPRSFKSVKSLPVCINMKRRHGWLGKYFSGVWQSYMKNLLYLLTVLGFMIIEKWLLLTLLR